MDKNYEFEFEIYTVGTEKCVYISGNNTTGEEISVTSLKDVGEAITSYLEEYYPNILK